FYHSLFFQHSRHTSFYTLSLHDALPILFDHSHFPIDENIEMTKELVEYAHSKGVSVEAEVGTVGGVEDGVTGGVKYADLEECKRDRKSTRLNSSHVSISYAVFCLKKKNI